MTWEARHKELRDALAATPGSVKFPSTAFQNVLDFEHRTGPLVREVVAVLRVADENAGCEDPQDGGPDPSRVGEYVQSWLDCGECLTCRIRSALSALDEEAARG